MVKQKIALVLFLFSSTLSFSQEDWNFYDIDSLVSLEMPGDVYETDTISMNRKVTLFYSVVDSTVYQVQRVFIEPTVDEVENFHLPKNKKELEELYSTLILGFIEGTDFEFQDNKSFERNGLIGRKTYFSYKEEDLIVYEMNSIYVNKSIYSFTYYEGKGVKTDDKVRFFDSVEFDSDLELKQFPTKPFDLRNGLFWKVIGTVLILSFLLRFWSNRKKTNSTEYQN